MIRSTLQATLGLALILAIVGMAWPTAAQTADKTLDVSWTASRYFVDSQGLHVDLHIEVLSDQPVTLENWALSSAAFSVDGHSLGSRKGKKELALEPGQVIDTRIDLSRAVTALEAWDRRPLRLTYHGVEGTEAQEVIFFEIAEKGIEFLELPAKQLKDYQILLRTNRGDMWIELWPDVAPNHVRNYLDLCYTGFYDGSQFHRVIPGFMIQGGQNKSGKPAPRTVDAEFSDRKHLPGVLSAARLPGQINSASTEFFLMHARYPSLDGKYSPYGQVLEGLEVINKIVKTGNRAFAPNDPRGHAPTTPQVIERALVVRSVAPPKKKDSAKKSQ